MTNFLLGSCWLLLSLAPEETYAQEKSGIHKLDSARQHEPEDLNVFQQWIRWNNGGSLLMNHLIEQAFAHYDIRDKAIAALKTKEDWLGRQREVREKLQGIVGPFPEKTALNPVVTGIVKKQGYRIEKIVYESFPGFYVTGCLFIPEKLKSKAPAVLNVIGHEQESYHAEIDQVIILNLVKKGMIVFAIDPLGQGEHVQYFDPKVNFSSVGYSVVEHCYFGNQCFLSGVSSARYFIWDGIRAIDYLVSRKEVDPSRIGVTGFSGGGTVTSYLGAFDERVKVIVPCSWSNATRRQLETKGAQDAEATLVNSVANGITFEDLIEVRAPKPTLMTFVSRDEYLCLQGAREAYHEAQKVYDAFGQSTNLKFVEDDARHWLTPKIRLAIYDFFMKHFNVKGDPAEVNVEILSPEELTVTHTGQISTSFGGDMVFDVNKRDTENLIHKLELARADIETHLASIPSKAKKISGYIPPPEKIGEPFINGRYQRNGYSVAKYVIKGEGEYAIPILFFVPNDQTTKHPALIYLHPQGKIMEAQPGGEIEKLVKEGYIVAATDVIGLGETENTASRGLADGYSGVLIGRSVVGIQAGDIARVGRFLKGHKQVDTSRIGAVAIDKMCLPLIHAAAFEPSIKSVTLIGALISYRTVAMNRHYKIGVTENEGGGTHHPYEVDFSWGVASVLTAYDLPDLIGCIAPRKVILAQLKDQMFTPASTELIDMELAFPRAAYASKAVPSNIKVVSDVQPLTALVDWSFE